MSPKSQNAVQKACLLTLFQLVLILLGYLYFAMNNMFQQAHQPQLKCMTVSDSKKICLSVFKRNASYIPQDKGIQAFSLHQNQFKVLLFKQDSDILENTFHNSVSQYFQLVEYGEQLKTISELKLDQQVSSLASFVRKQNGEFVEKATKKIKIFHVYKVMVFYLILQNNGPAKPQPQIRIIHATNNSVILNNKVNIIECFSVVIATILLTVYNYLQSIKNLSQFIQSQQTKRTNRVVQFLLGFGMINVIFHITVNRYWDLYGLGSMNNQVGFQRYLVPMIQGNAYESCVGMFPQWLFLSCYVHQLLERYLTLANFKLMVISASSAALLFLVPLGWPQFVFGLSIVLIGLFLGSDTKHNSNNRITISLVSTAFNLIIMTLIKIYWLYDFAQSNDFAMRFSYYQIFILGNIMSLFYDDEDTKPHKDRKYIPYDQHSMEQEQQFNEHQTVPVAQQLQQQ